MRKAAASGGWSRRGRCRLLRSLRRELFRMQHSMLVRTLDHQLLRRLRRLLRRLFLEVLRRTRFGGAGHGRRRTRLGAAGYG